MPLSVICRYNQGTGGEEDVSDLIEGNFTMFQFRHAKDERLGDEVGMDRRVVGGWFK